MKKLKITPSTSKSYASIKLADLDKNKIKIMKERISALDNNRDELKGFRIVVSEHDQITEEMRSSLIDGKFYEIK